MASEPDPFLLPREHRTDTGFHASPDFVERTLRRVKADRKEIAAEAARVDEIMLDRHLLSHYTVPPTGSDFVTKTLAALRQQHMEQNGRSADGSATLPVRPLLDVSQTTNPIWFRRAGLLAAAAIVLLSLIFVVLPRRNTSVQDLPQTVFLSAESFTPSPWATALARHLDEEDFARMPDPLLILAGGGR